NALLSPLSPFFCSLLRSSPSQLKATVNSARSPPFSPCQSCILRSFGTEKLDIISCAFPFSSYFGDGLHTAQQCINGAHVWERYCGRYYSPQRFSYGRDVILSTSSDDAEWELLCPCERHGHEWRQHPLHCQRLIDCVPFLPFHQYLISCVEIGYVTDFTFLLFNSVVCLNF
ncbi:hypothetical protein C8R45DRAFT_1213106, partial [Mycena sanguinolenta]